ncbi:MAG: methyl-accepting chemotaxis protein, partial [Deltaproteobacteria bacterium]
MKWFCNLKISLKLLIGFISVALIAGVIGVVGIINIRAIDKADTEMYETVTIPMSIVTNIAMSFQRERVHIRDMVLALSDEAMDKEINNIKLREEEISKFGEQLGKYVDEDRKKVLFDAFTNAQKNFVPFVQKTSEIAKSGKIKEAIQYMKSGDAAKSAAAYQEAIDNLVKAMVSIAKEKSDSNTKIANNATTMMIIFIAIGMILAIIEGIIISNMISKPVRKLAEAAEKLSVGDVGVVVKAETKDEIGDLMLSFSNMVQNMKEQAMDIKQIADGDLTVEPQPKSEKDVVGISLCEMVEKLNDIMANVNASADQVASAATQLASSSQSLSQGSTEQASTVEELNSSMEEVSGQIRDNASNAQRANEFAEEANSMAMEGNQHMTSMLASMNDINDSSKEISKIIKVIDEIAFQTNILALNAAV